jgi:hypothetical protein
LRAVDEMSEAWDTVREAGTAGVKAKEPDMRVQPYYSINPTDPDVHHVHDTCRSGQQIPAQNKRQGTNGYRLCHTCLGM